MLLLFAIIQYMGYLLSFAGAVVCLMMAFFANSVLAAILWLVGVVACIIIFFSVSNWFERFLW